MGAELKCSVTAGRRTAEGVALLETSEIVFRSASIKLKIPFSAISELGVTAAGLKITHAGGVVTLGIGEAAPKWAEKIRNPKSLVDKLGLKAGQRVTLLGVTDATIAAQIAARAEVSSRPGKDVDAIVYQSESVAGLRKLAQLQPRIKRDGAIWLVTPKGKHGIKYAEMLAAAKIARLVDVKISAWNGTHTATKLVIPKALR